MFDIAEVYAVVGFIGDMGSGLVGLDGGSRSACCWKESKYCF